MSKTWESLSPAPFECFSAPITHDDSNADFIFVPYKWIHSDYNQNVDGIYKYNATSDEWTEWIDYPKSNHFETSVHCAAVDPRNNILYIYNAQGTLITIDLAQESSLVQNAQSEVGNYAKCVVISSKLHVIGGNTNNSHFTVDTHDLKTYDTRHRFTKHGDRLYGHCIIYLKSQECVLLMGGEGRVEGSDCIYKYSLLNDPEDRHWELLEQKLPEPISQFGYIVTNDERQIVIFGGSNFTQGSSNKIYILDAIEMKWSTSQIQCPDFARYHALLAGNTYKTELLVYGYINCLYTSRKLSKYSLPVDILSIIRIYSDYEYIHLFQHFGGGLHWRIPLCDVLQSVQV
eukprot:201412_1